MTTDDEMIAVPSPTRHLKILVPAAAAGRIIGKGGTTIEQLQKEAGARVKMSKASEFYPGTTERVCLISGPICGILKINDFFLENLSSNLIKILVPNSTAGMIIGKGGSYIKEIKEKSGAYVQISQKSHDVTFPERCVTVIGELANIRIACEMILSKIVEDVGSGNYLNINYRDSKAMQQQKQNSSILGHQQQQQQQQSQQQQQQTQAAAQQQLQLIPQLQRQSMQLQQPTLTLTPQAAAIAAAATASQLTTTTQLNLNSTTSTTKTTATATTTLTASTTPPPLSAANSTTAVCIHTPLKNKTQNISNSISPCIPNHSPVSPNVSQDPTSSSAQMIYSIKALLQVSGYGEDEVSEITKAMSTLANYGVLGIGLGLL